jgi:hypothetical protein
MKKKVTRHSEPSKASLREMPEVDFARVGVRRNPYAERVIAEGIVRVGRGRPKRGAETGPTVPKSVRFPVEVWRDLESIARSEGLTLHSALRAAIAEWARARGKAGKRSRLRAALRKLAPGRLGEGVAEKAPCRGASRTRRNWLARRSPVTEGSGQIAAAVSAYLGG